MAVAPATDRPILLPLLAPGFLVGVQPKLTQVPEQLALDDRDLHPGLAGRRPGMAALACADNAASKLRLMTPVSRLRAPDQARPGRRVMTSWTIHALPSGSLKAKKDSVTRTFGVGAWNPRLCGPERHATCHWRQSHGGRDRYGPRQCQRRRASRRPSQGRPGVNPVPNVTEPPGARGRELDDTNILRRGDILIEPPTQASVYLFFLLLHVGHGDDVDL